MKFISKFFYFFASACPVALGPFLKRLGYKTFVNCKDCCKLSFYSWIYVWSYISRRRVLTAEVPFWKASGPQMQTMHSGPVPPHGQGFPWGPGLGDGQVSCGDSRAVWLHLLLADNRVVALCVFGAASVQPAASASAGSGACSSGMWAHRTHDCCSEHCSLSLESKKILISTLGGWMNGWWLGLLRSASGALSCMWVSV